VGEGTAVATNRVPHYQRIHSQLEQLILSGKLAPGSQVPTESELQAQHRVSRITAQQALRRLADQGLVVRQRGRGTYVLNNRPELNLIQAINFVSGLTESTGPHKVLSAKVVKATAENARVLEIPPGEPVVRLHRLKMEGELPAAVETSVVPFQLAPELLDQPLATLHLYTYFQESGVEMAEARMYLDPHVLTAEEARLLELEAGAAGFAFERISYSGHKKPVEFSRFVVRPDARRFYVQFSI